MKEQGKAKRQGNVKPDMAYQKVLECDDDDITPGTTWRAG
jgi:hypothetical protein